MNPVQVQRFLEEVDYPATPHDLARAATDQGADENLRAALERLPEGRYDTPADVNEALARIK